MRFLADENFPGDAVVAMQAAGHEVLWVRSVTPGITDDEVLRIAGRESRILLTFDKDFGELAFHRGLPATSGVVLFRLPMKEPLRAIQKVVGVLSSRTDWEGYFWVVEEDRIRMRPLPDQFPG